MIITGPTTVLKAAAALPAAGADVVLTAFTDCQRADYIVIEWSYAAAVALGAGSLRVKWTMLNGDTLNGTLLSAAGVLGDEVYPITGPGSVATKKSLIMLRVPAGIASFAGVAFESGDTGNPGTLAVTAWSMTVVGDR